MDYTVHGIVQARILEWVAFTFSNPVIEPRSPALQADSLTTELSGKHAQNSKFRIYKKWYHLMSLLKGTRMEEQIQEADILN